ncbi:MAG: Putative pyridoxal kinase [Alectoria fallacina]|uniref:pyridoxal kinase n=1 Tax=Alectoria fallacina TaxID=1903189 RepID=A0A8H3EPC1_9LECA|nr:MAG: Putative pyridoxal kinase [Alectoria fallacina]
MSSEPVVSETRVLAIASHVVYGYVGNKMAAFVMQAMGCDVAALNTVQFSTQTQAIHLPSHSRVAACFVSVTDPIPGNHTGYKQFKGTKTSAEEISHLYTGLKQSYLTDFDVMLTGYAPSAEAIDAIGTIARDLKLRASTKAGSFFWVLDPVMGDQGELYVGEDVVAVYRNLLRDADLILPNQFEAELLSEIKITSLTTLQDALATFHKTYRIPHVIITSIQLSNSPSTISVIGSTARADFSPRSFKIDVPAIDCFFSGTGDMFAALTVVRLREAVKGANLSGIKSWISSDDVDAKDLPLAKAAEKVIGSMHAILVKTKEARDQELEGMSGPLGVMEMEEDSEKRLVLRRTKAAEVRVVRCLEDLRSPRTDWKAEALARDEDAEGQEVKKRREQVLEKGEA